MKYLFLLTLLLPVSASAIYKQQNDKAPTQKVEISLLNGYALDMEDFKLYHQYGNTAVPLPAIGIYANFNRWQAGFVFETELVKEPYTDKVSIGNMVPQLVLNRTIEANDFFAFYAGVTAGYVTYKYYQQGSGLFRMDWDTRGHGVVGGLQGGVLLKMASFIAINLELGAKAREIKYIIRRYDYNYNNTPLTTPVESIDKIGRSLFYIPFKIGLRFRF